MCACACALPSFPRVFYFHTFFVFFSLYLLILLKYNLHEFSHRKCRIIVLLLCYYFVFSFFLLHAFFSRENCIFYSFIFVAFVGFFFGIFTRASFFSRCPAVALWTARGGEAKRCLRLQFELPIGC